MNVAHSRAVPAFCASFMVSLLGARLGNQTSYQFCDENSVFGTPRGGRCTVPMRMPSPSLLLLPSLTTLTATAASADWCSAIHAQPWGTNAWLVDVRCLVTAYEGHPP